jgi:OmcA/MtrC family decaheme c-type cytochrome
MAAATTVSDQSCLNCHGDNIFVDASGGFMSNAVDANGNQLAMGNRIYHFSSYGVESCVMCHGNVVGAHGGDRLMIYAHGIHNSNNFNGNYGSTAEVKSGWNFSVRYPTFMADCAACHNSEADLNTILDAPVTYNNCISCHGGVIRGETVTSDAQKAQAWRGFSSSLPAGHLEFTGATNCAACHSDDGYVSSANHSTISLNENCAVCHFQGLPPAYSTEAHGSFTQTLTCGACHAAPEGGIGQTVADFHSGYTDRGLAQKIADDYFFIAIDGVEPTETAGQYEIIWSAINPATGSAYDVCEPTTPVDGLGNVTFAPIVRLAYFEPNGDDITNPIGNVAGQPDNTIALKPNTICEAGVAVSTFSIAGELDPEITRVLALLKPQATVSATPALTLQGSGLVRIPAASYAFDREDGAFSPRRAIVDSNKCIDCHGSNLYNHSATGGRYDNVDSCIACHNSGATDQYVRNSLRYNGGPITPATSFDGKDAETFSLAYNMHAIHSAGATDAFYIVYRGRGLYGYGGLNTKPQNWPLDADGNARPYLSNTASYNLVTNAAGTSKVPGYLKKVNYPRPIADCTACHFEGTYDVPNQSKMVAVSLDSGTDLADQNDDLLVGPASAACMSCHNSNDPFVQKALYTHADLNGFAPQEFPNGKQDVLDFVKVETCVICH